MSVKGILSQPMNQKYIFLNYYSIQGRIRTIGCPEEAEVTLLKKEYRCKTEYVSVITLKPLFNMRVSRQCCINFIWIEVENFGANAWGFMILNASPPLETASWRPASRQADPRLQPQKVAYYPQELLWAWLGRAPNSMIFLGYPRWGLELRPPGVLWRAL